MNKFWVDNLRASLEVVKGNASRLPAGERLEVKDLNEILDLMEQCKFLFLLQCSLQGFDLQQKEQL